MVYSGKTYKSFSWQLRTTATACFVNRQFDYLLFCTCDWLFYLIRCYFLLIYNFVYVNVVNYYFVMLMTHLHLNELLLICDMWLNKITYLLTDCVDNVLLIELSALPSTINFPILIFMDNYIEIFVFNYYLLWPRQGGLMVTSGLSWEEKVLAGRWAHTPNHYSSFVELWKLQ